MPVAHAVPSYGVWRAGKGAGSDDINNALAETVAWSACYQASAGLPPPHTLQQQLQPHFCTEAAAAKSAGHSANMDACESRARSAAQIQPI
jgi:hypothetical protein